MSFGWVGHLGGRRTTVLAAIATAVLAAPAAAGAAPTALFVGNYGNDSTISQFTIGSGGLLSPNGTAPTGSATWMLAASPNGKYLYGTNWGDGTVSQFSVGSNGTLTPLSPATVNTTAEPETLAVSPDGMNVYVASQGSIGSGAVSVYGVGSAGTLSLVQTVTTDLTSPSGIAVSPDGSSVYAADSGSGEIVQFNRSSDGTLTPKSTPTVPIVETGFLSLVFTPDGKNLYASGTDSGTIEQFTVGTGGELAATGAPAAEGSGNYELTVSPNGHNLYAPACYDGTLWQYSISSTGALSSLTPPFLSTGGCPEESWMTATGANLYTPDFTNDDVLQFGVSSATGALSPLSPPTAPAGTEPGAVVIPPDQGPVAAFSSKAGKVGKATTFNASKSSDSDGTVASYQWSFGDGSTKTTTSPTVSHTYKKAGSHKVTLTVTDDSGCSTTQVFTGQTAYCNGTSAATASHTVKIAAAIKPLKLSVTPRSAKAGVRTCYALHATSKGHGVKKVTVKLAGHKATTSGSGKAKLCLTLKKGTHTAKATKKGYAAAAARVRVSAATSPAFTG